MKFIDLFCGIGGFRHGLERTNDNRGFLQETTQEERIQKEHSKSEGRQTRFTCVYANDNDKYACQVYRKHWGNNELHEGDIRAVDIDTIPEHDLLCAGFPCQSFSIAGQGGGFADARGTLFFEICRIAGAKGTPYLLLENVRNLLSVPYTKGIQEWVEADFDEVTGEPTEKALKKRKAIPGTKGWVFLTILNSLWELGFDVQWCCLNSKDFGVPQNRERVFIIGHLRGKPRPKVFPIRETNEMVNGQSTGRPTIQNKYSTAIHSRYNAGWRSHAQEQYISTAIDGNYYKGVDKHGERTMIHNIYGRVRRLTPLECERLQGFPDGWTEGISDTQRYKCLGNAVTVNVIEAIGVKL